MTSKMNLQLAVSWKHTCRVFQSVRAFYCAFGYGFTLFI